MRACRRLRGSVAGAWSAGGWRRATGGCRGLIRARRSTGRQSESDPEVTPPLLWRSHRRPGSDVLALTYVRSIPSYAIVKAAGGRPEVATSALSMPHLGDVAEPELPGRDWVRVSPTLSGICGSD